MASNILRYEESNGQFMNTAGGLVGFLSCLAMSASGLSRPARALSPPARFGRLLFRVPLYAINEIAEDGDARRREASNQKRLDGCLKQGSTTLVLSLRKLVVWQLIVSNWLHIAESVE
jgi:hypothetical protein